MAPGTSTTLADLFTPFFAANPGSTGIAAVVGRAGGPLILFFPFCSFEPAILEECISDHRHERMTMQTLPGSTLEVIEAKFFFQLLMSLTSQAAFQERCRSKS
jgi:hypothetical protein